MSLSTYQGNTTLLNLYKTSCRLDCCSCQNLPTNSWTISSNDCYSWLTLDSRCQIIIQDHAFLSSMTYTTIMHPQSLIITASFICQYNHLNQPITLKILFSAIINYVPLCILNDTNLKSYRHSLYNSCCLCGYHE